MTDDIELIQFRYSPYNEKVRWALDLGRIDHRRRSVLPGPHRRVVRRLTGQTKTPILKLNGRWLNESSRILDALGERFPACGRLFPGDPALKRRAIDIQAKFDDEYGPAIRRAVLSSTMRDLGYMADMFASGRARPVAAAYRLTMPLAARLIRKGNGLDQPRAYEQGMQAIDGALNWIAANTSASGYLVSDQFSVADVTAAAMLAAVANPPDSPVTRPLPLPDHLSTWLDAWHDHPGTIWVRNIYAKHRSLDHDFEGSSRYATSWPALARFGAVHGKLRR